MRKLTLTAGIGLLLLATACEPDKNLVNCDFDQQAMLANYVDNIIVPRHENLGTGLSLLEASIQAFVNDPTVGMLIEVRVTYIPTYTAYQDCGAFAFGPGLIGGIPFRDRFNTFPTNTQNIGQNIQNGTPVADCPKSAVGFPAMDFLLFGEAGMTDQQIVDLFVTDGNAVARKAYLLALATEMKTTNAAIIQGWASQRSQFIANVGTAEGSSISLLVNELNYDSETLKNFKFKIPLGKFNGGIVLPNSVEALYSGLSLELADRHAHALKDLFMGVGTNGSDGLGLDDYLDCLEVGGDEPLKDDMIAQFDNIIAGIGAIPGVLSEALVNNKPVVDAAYDQMQMMVPLMKHEMTSALGVQINYQDNDGD